MLFYGPIRICPICSSLSPPLSHSHLQQELTKKQAAELCALFRSRLEGGQRTRAASALNNGLGLGSGAGASGSGSGSAARQFVPSAVPASPAWAGGASGSNGGAEMEAGPSGPPDMGGKTFAQLQAEEERAARIAAKASAKQTAGSTAAAQRPPSAGGTTPAVPRPTPVVAQPAARAAVPVQQQVQQQPAAAAAASTTAAGSRAAGPTAGAGTAVANSAQASGKPALEQLGDELTALKGTLRPMIATLAAAKVCSASQEVALGLRGCSMAGGNCARPTRCSPAPCALSLGWCCALGRCCACQPPQSSSSSRLFCAPVCSRRLRRGWRARCRDTCTASTTCSCRCRCLITAAHACMQAQHTFAVLQQRAWGKNAQPLAQNLPVYARRPL